MTNPVMPTDRMPSTPGPADASRLRLTLRSDVVISQNAGPSGKYTIGDPLRGRYYEVGERERSIIVQMDGQRTIGEIAAAMGNEDPELPSLVPTVGQWLLQNNLVRAEGTDNGARLAARQRQIADQSLLAWLNPLCIRIPLLRPDRLLRPLDGFGRLLFSLWGLAAWLALLMIAGFVLAGQWAEFSASWRGILSGQRWLWLMAAWIVLKALHETGHALACRRFGGRVGEAGILLLLFTPLAWVDVTSSWAFTSRFQRAIVAAAGMYLELAVAAAAVLVWNSCPDHPAIRDLCFQVVLMASLTTVLFNANPLMKFDGYFILTDLAGVNNLYSRGQTWFRNSLRYLCLGWTSPAAPLEGTARWLVPLHGSLATVWRCLVTVTLLVAAGAVFHGAGAVLALAAAVVWLGLPLWNGVRELRREAGIRPVNRRHIAWSAGGAVVLAAGCFLLLGGPASQAVPAVVQLVDERILRAADSGFVTRVLVRDGESVSAGQPLVEMENRELEFQTRDLELQLDSARIQARRLLDQRRLAQQQSASETVRDLERRLDESRTALQSMTIRAPFDGIVLQRNLDSLCGVHLEKGAEVLTIVPGTTRRVVASVGQDDPAAAGLATCHEARIVFSGLPVSSCRVAMFTPRADVRPPHPALCAAAGGPLPVKSEKRNTGTSRQPEYELLSPRLSVELELPAGPGQDVFPGQTGRVILPARQYSLGVWAGLQASAWLRHKIDVAFASR